MKIFFKILFIFLSFLILQSFSTHNAPQEISSHINYIQNGYQKVVLTSENMRGSEICIAQSGDTQSFSSGNALASAQISPKVNLNKNSVQNGRFIHNLSTDLNTEILIRAP